MTETEREQWMDRLAALTWETREPAIYALLDRVEELERQLTEARTARSRHCGRIIAVGADSLRCLGCGDCWTEEREEAPCKPT